MSPGQKTSESLVRDSWMSKATSVYRYASLNVPPQRCFIRMLYGLCSVDSYFHRKTLISKKDRLKFEESGGGSYSS